MLPGFALWPLELNTADPTLPQEDLSVRISLPIFNLALLDLVFFAPLHERPLDRTLFTWLHGVRPAEGFTQDLLVLFTTSRIGRPHESLPPLDILLPSLVQLS